MNSEADNRASNVNRHNKFMLSLKADEGNGKNDGLGIAARMTIAAKADQIRISMVPQTSMNDISEMAMKLLSAYEDFKVKGADEEFAFIPPQVSEPVYSCPICSNKDQRYFMADHKEADIICLGQDGKGCGMVVQDHKPHEGSMYRAFEGEVDRSHHGMPPDRLYSAAYNMKTHISKGGTDSSKLTNLSGYVELNLSSLGRNEKRTRVGYKDQMKKKAFDDIDNVAANCELHMTVVDLAKQLFATWRDIKDSVTQMPVVVCSAVIAAYRSIAVDELKAQENRRQGALSELQIRCKRCGSTDPTMCSPDPKSSEKYICKVPISSINGGKTIESSSPLCKGQIEVIVPPSIQGTGINNNDALYPFTCRLCKEKFNAQKALDVHSHTCPKQIMVGDTVGWRHDSNNPSARFTVVDISPEGQAQLRPINKRSHSQVSREDIYAPVEDTAKIMDPSSNIKNTSDTSGVSTALNEWTVEDTRQWLQWAAVSQDKKYLDPVLTALEKAVDGGGRNENEDISKRKRKRTAGQVVQMWSAGKFAELCSGDAEAGARFHAAISRKCKERKQFHQNEQELKHARQRHSQLLRKPWVQAVNRELLGGGSKNYNDKEKENP